MSRKTKQVDDFVEAMSAFEMHKIAERLAAYEETLLTPEQIIKLKAERDAAVRDLHRDCKVCAKMFPCAGCLHNPISEIQRVDNWIWRGQQQEVKI